jgi:HemY protein
VTRASQALYDAARLRIEGRFGQALKQAALAYEAKESPGLAALLAARAAHSLRDEERYREWLAKAAAHDDNEVRVARLMTEAELAVEGRRFDEAAECIAALQAGGQRTFAALRLALRTAQAKGNWVRGGSSGTPVGQGQGAYGRAGGPGQASCAPGGFTAEGWRCPGAAGLLA